MGCKSFLQGACLFTKNLNRISGSSYLLTPPLVFPGTTITPSSFSLTQASLSLARWQVFHWPCWKALGRL